MALLLGVLLASDNKEGSETHRIFDFGKSDAKNGTRNSLGEINVIAA